MQQLLLKITGISPVLMHSDKLSDPLAPETVAHKQLTSKRRKTEDDHLAIARSEFASSAYFDGAYYLPGHMLKACMVNAAKLNRLGTTVKRSVLVLDDKCFLETDKATTPPAELFDDLRFRDARSVVVSSSRLMRYRPIFKKWATNLTLVFDEAQIDEVDLLNLLSNAGNLIGVGDYRVEKGGGFGRFSVEVQ